MRTIAGLGAVVLLVVLTGCSTAPGPSTAPSPSDISPRQRSALADGDITWDEYESGFNDYRACLQKEGYSLVDPHRVGDVFEAGVPGPAVESGVNDQCYAYTWQDVDTAWQVAHEDTSSSAEIVAACLRAHGIEPQTSYQRNLGLMEANHLSVDQCPSETPAP